MTVPNKSVVQCSAIIKDGDEFHASASTLVGHPHKLSKYCFHCLKRMRNIQPLYIPHARKSTNNYVVGPQQVCSPECGKGYILETYGASSIQLVLFSNMLKEVYNFADIVAPAAPREWLVDFGGDISRQQYHKVKNIKQDPFLRMPLAREVHQKGQRHHQFLGCNSLAAIPTTAAVVSEEPNRFNDFVKEKQLELRQNKGKRKKRRRKNSGGGDQRGNLYSFLK
tara:strand:- start:19542 stop:20213 length:672 start_codon:yes stop_codon:yes gene_type:complete